MKITAVQLTPVLSRRETGHTNPHVIVQLHTDGDLVGLGEMSDLAHDKFKFDLRDLKDSLSRSKFAFVIHLPGKVTGLPKPCKL